MLLSGFATFLGIAVVIGVVGYRFFRAEGSAAPSELVAHAAQGRENRLDHAGEDRIVVTLEIAGATEIRTFDLRRCARPAGCALRTSREFQDWPHAKTSCYRKFWFSMGVAFVTIGAVFLVTAQFVPPAPPKKVVIAAAGEGTPYYRLAEQYQRYFAQNGVTLEIHQTAASSENLKLLAAPKSSVEIGFLQGGPSVERVIWYRRARRIGESGPYRIACAVAGSALSEKRSAPFV